MARLCNPAEGLELTGAFIDNPARRRAPDPKSPCPIGGPPVHLTPDEAGAWDEIIYDASEGVLALDDRWVMELAARLIAQSRREGLTGAETGYLRACLGALGVSPASRSRLLPVRSAEVPRLRLADGTRGRGSEEVAPFDQPAERH
jgi:hypothetical protein